MPKTSTSSRSKKRIVVGNWKMYLEKPEEAKRFASALRKRARAFVGVDAALAPSFTLLPTVAAALAGSPIKVGAQAVSAHEAGAHTGDVSAVMAKAAGASFTLVGHSERRAAGDTNALVHEQLVRAASVGMNVILCVGEVERTQDGAYFTEVEEQLASAFKGAQSYASRVTIAYEPVWAIGKSAADAMQPNEVHEMVIFIRKVLSQLLDRTAAMKLPVLYGGSVEPANAVALMAESGASGFLVGHASAELDSFIEILKACKN